MIRRILLAVDDSPAALAAARVAIDLAACAGATVRVLTVFTDDRVPQPPGRREQAAASVLRYVAGWAQRAAVPVEDARLTGEPAACILDEATGWSADLIVVGRAGSSGAGAPYIGGQTRRVLEFAEIPVLVVPPPQR
jgi:nucleotide-binding universal stress UspA family protein